MMLNGNFWKEFIKKKSTSKRLKLNLNLLKLYRNFLRACKVGFKCKNKLYKSSIKIYLAYNRSAST